MPVNLKELTKYKANKGGIYALAPDKAEDPDTPFQMKVGRTVNFETRLNSYHLCFNGGYRMIALLPLKNTCPKDLREKRSRELEKRAHDILFRYKKSYPNRSTSRGSEWYAVSINHIKKVFQDLHNEYKSDKYDLTASPILNFEDDYLNKFVTYSDTTNTHKVKSSTPDKVVISLKAKVKQLKPKTIKPKKKIKMNMKKVSSIKKIKDILKQ